MNKFENGNKFKETVRFLRKQNRMTQNELGDVLGYGYSAISNYESGRNEPSINNLIKIADYFNVSIDYLVGHELKISSANNYEYTIKLKKLSECIHNFQKETDEIIKGIADTEN